MVDLAQELLTVESLGALPDAALAAARRLTHVCGCTASFLEGQTLTLLPTHGWFAETPFEHRVQQAATLAPQLVPLLRWIATIPTRQGSSFNVTEHLDGSRRWRRLLRAAQLDRALFGFVRHEDQLLGVIGLYRNLADKPFSVKDEVRVRRLCKLLAVRYIALAAEQPRVRCLAALLGALESQFPCLSMGLFGNDGELVWLSDELALRLGLTSHAVGTQRIIVAPSRALEAVRHTVREARRTSSATRRLRGLKSGEVLHEGEQLVTRQFGNGEMVLVLVLGPQESTRRGAASGPAEQRIERAAALRGRLSQRESEVAELATRGYSVGNMAAHLGLRETTIKTLLQRTYRKLQVRNRAELCFIMLSSPLGQ